MVPNQKDVLTDYLNDMFGIGPSEVKESSKADEVLEPGAHLTDEKTLEVEDSSSLKIEDVREEFVEALTSQHALKASADSEVNSPTAVKEKEASLNLTAGISTGLSEISFQIDPDKQIACLIDLVNKPLDKLSEGERSLVLIELLDLIKQVPESRLKSMLRRQYEDVQEFVEVE